MKKIPIATFLFFLVLILPVVVLADWKDCLGGLCITGPEAELKDVGVGVFVGRLIQAVLSLLGIIVLVFLIYGGYLWLMSGGNEQTLRKAKDILINAAIGLIIVLAAFAITTFIVEGISKAVSSP